LAPFLNVAAGFELGPLASMEEAYEFAYFAALIGRAYTLGAEQDGVHHVCGEGARLGDEDADVELCDLLCKALGHS
jgi:hypothetical protein